MNINFSQIGNPLVPGVYVEVDPSKANRSLPAGTQKLMIVGQRLKAMIEPARFQGGTLNDMASGGTYTGGSKVEYQVKISTAGTPDKFQWSKDNGATWSSEIVIDGAAQTLEAGVTVTFTATTGHAVDDEWRFGAWPEPSVAEQVPTQVWSAAEAAADFGYGSTVHLIAKAALEAAKKYELHICALDDAGAGVAATKTITVAGTVTVAGNARLCIGNKKVEINVAKDDAAAAIAIALQNEIAQYLDQLPGNVAVNQGTPGQIDFTAKNKGTVGNQIAITSELTAQGITITIADGVAGATDPTLSDALDAASPGAYTIYITPYNDSTNLNTLKTHLDEVSGPSERRRGIGVAGYIGTVATAISLAATQNHRRINIPYLKNASSFYRDTPYELAAGYAAMIAVRSDPATPLNGDKITGLHSPVMTDQLTEAEKESLLAAGITPLEASVDGYVRVCRAVTTYIKNDQQVDDTTWRELSTTTVVDYAAVAYETRLALRFQQAKNSPRMLKEAHSENLDVAYQLQEAELIKDVDELKDQFVEQFNDTDPNRLDCYVPIKPVGAVHVIAIQLGLFL